MGSIELDGLFGLELVSAGLGYKAKGLGGKVCKN